MRNRNIELARKHSRRHYEKNKAKTKRKVRERKLETRQWLAEYKSEKACGKCGENHPACLEFHHKDATKKEINLSNAVQQGWGRDRILKEIEKCEVLCSNCHKKLHWELLRCIGGTEMIVGQ